MAFPENATIEFDSGSLFRVGSIPRPNSEHGEGSVKRYHFVQRKGMTAVIPVTSDGDVLTIWNNRPHYGKKLGFPGGNIDGTFDEPEEPIESGLRELVEEIGYNGDAQGFLFPELSTTIHYPQYLIVARNVIKFCEPHGSDAAQIEIAPTPAADLVSGLADGGFRTPFPYLELAITRAVQKFDVPTVTDWLVTGDNNIALLEAFGPNLLPLQHQGE